MPVQDGVHIKVRSGFPNYINGYVDMACNASNSLPRNTHARTGTAWRRPVESTSTMLLHQDTRDDSARAERAQGRTAPTNQKQHLHGMHAPTSSPHTPASVQRNWRKIQMAHNHTKATSRGSYRDPSQPTQPWKVKRQPRSRGSTTAGSCPRPRRAAKQAGAHQKASRRRTREMAQARALGAAAIHGGNKAKEGWEQNAPGGKPKGHDTSF